MGSDSEMPAARLGDIDTGHPPAPPTPIITGSLNVFINGRPAARKDDMLAPHHPGIRMITEGSASVFINGKPAARVSDSINCGGKIITGSSDVQIGNRPGGVRNAITSAEFSDYIRESLKPGNIGLSRKQEAQLAADIAVKYRGPEGAIATWHDYFMSDDPEPGDINDPAKKEGLKRAQIERGLVSGSIGSGDVDAFRQAIQQNQSALPPSVTSKAFLESGISNATGTASSLPSYPGQSFVHGVVDAALNQVAPLTSLGREDGQTVQPFTGTIVSKKDRQDAAFNNLLGVGGATGKLGGVAEDAVSQVAKLAKGSRPPPSSYLDESYIQAHLDKFKDGASFITKKSTLEKYGREKIGMPDNSQFVMPNSQMNEVLKKAAGNVSTVERELGIPSGAWQGDDLIRIDISQPFTLGLRVPSGNELGANEHWLPAGKLPTGYDEAVLNQIPNGSFLERPLW